MFRFTKSVAVALVLAASSTVTGAQAATTLTKPFSLGFSGGASIPFGDLSSAVNTGYSLNGHVALAAPLLPISFRGDVGYNNWGAQGGGSNAHMWSFTGNAVYSLAALPIVHPYLIGGIGAYKGGVSSGSLTVNDNTSFGYNIGGGVTLPLSGFNTFVEARYNQVTGGSSAKFVPITFGVMF